MNRDLVIMAVSKWLNEYKEKNKLKPEEIATELDCSFGYIELLLDFKDHPTKYQNTNVPIRFLAKLRDTYKVSIDEVLEKDERYVEAKANNEKVVKLVNSFRDKIIGKEFDIDTIKSEIPEDIVIKNISEDGNLVSFEIDKITIIDMERQNNIKKFEIILKDNTIKYFVLEQSFSSFMYESLIQRYYFDTQNELFVSSVYLGDVPMLFDMNYETMIKFNNKFIYQDRYTEEEEAYAFNNKIHDEIINGRTLEDIKKTYNNMEQEEEDEEDAENDM